MASQNNPRICVPLCATTFGELEQLAQRAANVADVIEFRFDCLHEQELTIAREKIDQLAARLSIPCIFTFRPSEQGGYRELSIEQRRQYWRETIKPTNALFDIEKDLCEEGTAPDWSQVICSHHNFADVPESIEKLYEEMAATPARVLKIAIFAHDISDCLPVFRLLRRASEEKRDLIALAMGDAGLCSRVLGPSHGSFLTYASVQQGAETAPGQLTVEQMHSVYRIRKITKQTAVYGLVGSPVMHSISPNIHNAAFEAKSIDAIYLPFEVKNLKSFMERMAHPDSRELDWRLQGLSITAPHKLQVMPQLDWIDARAKEVGAVNTVVVEGSQLRGYNTDADGFIQPLLKRGVDKKWRVALIGAGGAANAAVWSLKEHGVEVVLFVRDLEKSQLMGQRFGVVCEPLDGASFQSFDVVINATPLGSSGSKADQTPATAEQLRGVKLVYDLVYNPAETRFMREAKSAGSQTLGGLEMLVAQAALQFKLWTGEHAPEDVMRSAALRAL
jgi:3-dehydroquinate dehydratase/shikimate dehydrogenase